MKISQHETCFTILYWLYHLIIICCRFVCSGIRHHPRYEGVGDWIGLDWIADVLCSLVSWRMRSQNRCANVSLLRQQSFKISQDIANVVSYPILDCQPSTPFWQSIKRNNLSNPLYIMRTIHVFALQLTNIDVEDCCLSKNRMQRWWHLVVPYTRDPSRKTMWVS